jgi:hypothetical protein
MTTYNRPGRGVYLTNGNTATINHGAAVALNNYVGCAVKQKAIDWNVAVANATVIQKKEDFFLITKGVVMIPAIAEVKRGDAIYINEETGVVQTSGTKGIKFGRVHDAPGQRGTPTGFMRVDLDQKATL